MSLESTHTYIGVRNIEDSIAWQFSETYLDFSGKPRCRFITIDHQITARRESANSSIGFTVLKGLSLIVIFIPVIAYLIRSHYRKKHQIYLIQGHVHCVADKALQIFQNKFLTDYHINGTIIPEIDFTERFQTLRSSIGGVYAYFSTQNTTLDIVHLALHQIVNAPNTPDIQKFAQDVYREVSKFLRRHSRRDLNYDSYMQYLVVPNRISSIGLKRPSESLRSIHFGAREKHVLLCSLLHFLRKQIKLSRKADKIKQYLSDQPELLQISPEKLDLTISLLNLTWLHGTKAFTIKSACEKTNKHLVPTGRLRTLNVDSFSGANDVGASHFGVNTHCLSGVGLASADQAIKSYALLTPDNSHTEFDRCIRFLRGDFHRDNYYFDRNGEFTRITLAFKRVKASDPERFEEIREELQQKLKLLQEVEALYIPAQTTLNNFAESSLLEYYSYIKSFNQLEKLSREPFKPSTMTQEDRELAEIGVVVASNNRYGVLLPLEGKIQELEEEIYSGSMELGEEIQYFFTDEKHIPRIEELVNTYGLAGRVHVLSFEDLHNAYLLEWRLRPYFVDIFSHRKWVPDALATHR